MTSSTANKVVGNTFKNVVVNENGEFVVDTLLVAEKEIALQQDPYINKSFIANMVSD